MSNQITGWFYLHTNGELIYKNSPDAIIDIRESDLATCAWSFNNDRRTAWGILVEALSIGVKESRINELAGKWGCTDNDALEYANAIEINLSVDGDKKTAYLKSFTNITESPIGFGDTYLQAMASLCKQIGYTGGKMWNATFEDLIKTN